MNSYIRQTAIPADQMHSFLKDKQAWENAIGMYQGPDPLDHWYNYVCWYENHGHGDPENKFRETLERCLTLFEHNDYYKQDPRMTRLWLKYIDMQSNPLHFYQVLYQRGVGRQLAAFYVSWAGYYESVQAAKEAESVYNLGFQEKAQPYVELHHAYNKFVYTRNAAAAAAAAALQQQHQHQQQQAQVQVQKVVASHQFATAAAAAAAAATPTTTLQHHGHQVSQAQNYHRQLQQQQQQHLYHQQAQSTQHVSYQQSPHTTPLTTPLHTHTNHQHTHPHHQHQPQPPHVHQHPHATHPPQQSQPTPTQLHHHHPTPANPNQNQQHHQHQHQHPHQHQPTHTHTHPHMPPQHEHHQLTTPTPPSPQQTQPQALHQQQQPQVQLHQHQHLHHQPQHHHQQHPTQPQQPQTLSHHHNQQQHQHHHNHHQNQNHHHQHNQQTNHLQTQRPHATTEVDAAATSTVSHYHIQEQHQTHMNGTATTSDALYQAQQQQQHQQHLQQHHSVVSTVTTTSAATNTQVQIQQHYERVQHELNHVATTEPATVATASDDPTTAISNSNINNTNISQQHTNNETIGGIRLPRRFAAYCRNNFETWKPALFLEEPADPSRHCHYAKNLVYPGDGCEYSPEELRTQRYAQRIEGLRRQEAGANQQQQHDQQQPVQLQPSATASSDDALSREPPFEGFYTHEQQRQLQHQHLATLPQYSLNGVEYRTHVTDDPDNSEENGEDEYERDNEYEAAEDAEDDDDEEEDNEEEEGVDADADNDEDDDDDDAVRVTQRQMLHQQQQQYQQQQQLQHMQAQPHFHHIAEDVEDQIEASTIRLSQNKTIKIKFRKERPQMGESFNGSGNYSAYTIENIYQHEAASSATVEEQIAHRNGHHSFHPYRMGQTSTPKASVKRSKSKLKRANKFQAIAGSSSNSSSAENATAMHTHCMEDVPHGSAANAASNGHTTNGGANSGGGGGGGGGGSASGGHHQTIENANYNDNANYSFLSAATLENSNCSLTSAVDRLNFRDATVHGNHQRSTNDNNNTTITNNNNHTNNVADFSTYQENSYFATQHDTEAKERRLQKALEAIERHLAKDAIDPFNSELCRAFLTKLDFPGAEEATHANYKIIQTPLPKIANSRALTLPDGLHFNIDKEVGRGSYGSVYKATDVNSGAVVALKFQKPPNTWEIYICDQVLKRVTSPSVLPGLMDVSTAIIAPNASLIATEFSPFGSLLDINNKIRQATSKVMHESLVMHFTAQICNIIQHLHRQQIIHADIKPDNFLLMRIPNTDLHYPSLRLIDFGCAIDMTLFPDQTKFRKVIQTDGFTCIEMQEGRPWSYETDLFCIAGTVHVMLMGEYMQLQKRAGAWDIKQKLPRYLKKHVWTKFFGGMLNIRNGGKLPDLCELRALFDEEAAKMDSELQKQIRTLSNILYRR